MVGTGQYPRNMEVLLVEDRGVMRALLRDFLQSSIPGLVIIEAANGARALKIARERRPQVVLMDINLPDANGIELTAQIKAMLPDARIIIVTGLNGSAYVERALAAGAFAYVTKDKIYAELLPLMMSALNAAPARNPDGGAV